MIHWVSHKKIGVLKYTLYLLFEISVVVTVSELFWFYLYVVTCLSERMYLEVYAFAFLFHFLYVNAHVHIYYILWMSDNRFLHMSRSAKGVEWMNASYLGKS